MSDFEICGIHSLITHQGSLYVKNSFVTEVTFKLCQTRLDI